MKAQTFERDDSLRLRLTPVAPADTTKILMTVPGSGTAPDAAALPSPKFSLHVLYPPGSPPNPVGVLRQAT
jgi:hypothetical protein